MSTRGFKQAGIAFVTRYYTRHGYTDRDVYSAERIRAKDRDWWVSKAALRESSCPICGHSVDVGDIAVATRKKRTLYAKRMYWFVHERCLKHWAAKHPIKSASVKKQ